LDPEFVDAVKRMDELEALGESEELPEPVAAEVRQVDEDERPTKRTRREIEAPPSSKVALPQPPLPPLSASSQPVTPAQAGLLSATALVGLEQLRQLKSEGPATGKPANNAASLAALGGYGSDSD